MEKSFLYGITGGLLLLLIYFGLLTVVNSFEHAVLQFTEMWYWILALVIGFGVQVGLYFHIRERAKICAMSASGTGAVAASGGISAGSMVLCCLHHLADFLPLIGLSAAALFLSQYQVSFMVLGILSNLVGITIMLNFMQKHGVRSFRFDMHEVRDIMVVASILLFSLVLLSNMYTGPAGFATATNSPAAGNDIISLGRKTNDEAGVSIDIIPVGFAFGRDVVFQIGLTTHQGSLDFDPKDIAVLKDSSGDVYRPVKWDGSPPGGHHRSGSLTFPPIENAEWMELALRDIYGVPERAFRWEL